YRGGCDSDTNLAHACIQAGREDRRSAGHVPGRHLHGNGQPGGDLRRDRALRNDESRFAGGDAGPGGAFERRHGLPRGAGGGSGAELGASVMSKGARISAGLIVAILATAQLTQGAPRKAHTVVLGAVRKAPYTKAGDPAGAAAGEDTLKIRALLVDGVLKEWTTGEAHDVTDRSFVVRRAIKLNDALPGDESKAGGRSNEKPAPAASRWVWQRGPWLLVDRVTGRIAALKLPDYDPGVSQVSWFRDYGAYCGVTASGKSLYAVVAQVAA